MRTRTLAGLLFLVVFTFFACSQEQPVEPQFGQEQPATLAKKSAEETAIQNMLDNVNAQLAAAGKDYVAAVVEYITPEDSDEIGRTVFFRNLGNKQLGHHFVPLDSRRAWSGPGSAITWINDTADGATSSGLTAATTAAAIRSAMATWEGVTCSTIPLNDLGDINFDLGVVQFLLGFGGVNGLAADITHAGFLPGAFFDAIVPGGSTFILGVTFTFIFVSGPDPTDIDNNGKLDTAFREIYYNDNFNWVINQNIPGFPDFDVETVALHEAGHGLSQAHFGTAFRDAGSGKLHFSPRAVMNAAYSGIQQSIAESDNGGHCSIWAHWPNN